MADSRFFSCHGPFTSEQLVQITGAELVGDPTRQYQDVASLETANAEQVSFLDNRKYLNTFKTSEAGICIVHPDLAKFAPEGMNLLLTEAPYMAYAKVSQSFYPAEKPETNISDRAFVAESAEIGEGARIEPGAYIAENAVVGSNCWVKGKCCY